MDVGRQYSTKRAKTNEADEQVVISVEDPKREYDQFLWVHGGGLIQEIEQGG